MFNVTMNNETSDFAQNYLNNFEAIFNLIITITFNRQCNQACLTNSNCHVMSDRGALDS